MSALHRVHGALARRPTLAAALVYALLVVVFLGAALLPGKTLSNADTLWFDPPWDGVRPAALAEPSNTELGDAPGQLQPFLWYAADRMPEEIPLWNPYIVGGRPFLANAQSAVFSPYTLPAYVFSYDTALTLAGLLKLWVAAFGMFLLASRALRMSWAPALFAGVVFGFSLWMVTWLSYPHMSAWSWMPWLLLLADRLVRRPDLLSGAALAGVFGVEFLSGHPESSFHVALATALFFLLRLVMARRDDGADARRLGRTVLAFGGAAVAGLALAALVVVPFAELLWHSADLHARSNDSVDLQPVSREFALGLFMPDFWGRPTATPVRFFVLDRAFYLGALPLMLAVAALVIRPNLERIAVAAFGAVWMGVLLGIPPFLQIVTRLPVFSSGHNSRLTALFVLALAMLAGWGMDDLVRGRWQEQRRRLIIAAGAAILVVPVLWAIRYGNTSIEGARKALEVAWGFATAPGGYIDPNTGGRACIQPCVEAGNIMQLASMMAWVPLAGASLLLIFLRVTGRLRPVPFAVLGLLVVVIDLFHIGMGYNPAIERRWNSPPATPAVQELERERPARFVSTEGIPQTYIPMRFGLYEARGYDLPILERFDRLWRQEVSPESSSVAKGLLDTPLTLRELSPRGLHVLRLLGVTRILQPPRDEPLSAPGVSEVYDGADARVYRVSGALPRVFVVGGQRVVG
ncbi:MAG: hypothetical protein JW895_11695, partial [Thermoleophilaceae bacterium]|nr:hypothetical protein [Thermoleophilaceae bacterium]